MSAPTQNDRLKDIILVDPPKHEGKDESNHRFVEPTHDMYIVELTGNGISHEFGHDDNYDSMRSFEDYNEAVEAVVVTILEYSRYYWDIIEKLGLNRDDLRKELAEYVDKHQTSYGFFDDKKFHPRKTNVSKNRNNTLPRNATSRNAAAKNAKSKDADSNKSEDKFYGWHVNIYTVPVYKKARDYMPKLD